MTNQNGLAMVAMRSHWIFENDELSSGKCSSSITLLFDSAGKLFQMPPVVEGTLRLGYPRDLVFTLGLILLACVLVYLIPRTSVLGALLLTGYLGGAVATHVRVDSPLLTHALVPVYVAAVLWAGLLLRDGRLRGFLGSAS